MFNIKKILGLFVIILAVMSLAAPAYAQDGNIIVIPEGTPSPELAAEIIISVVYTLIAQPFLAPLVEMLVALSKRAKWIKNVRPEVLNFTWSGLLFILWMLAARFGLGAQFESGVTLLIGLGTYALGQYITPISASALYKQAKKNDIAILGYSRPTASDIANEVYGKADAPILAEAVHD